MQPELMTDFATRLKALSSAEDFLHFFAVAYDERVVNVNRLHILKRFFQYLQREHGLAEQNEVDAYRLYRMLLTKAYQDFVVSDAQTEKVFKVFQDVGGTQHVGLSGLRSSLSGHRRGVSAAA